MCCSDHTLTALCCSDENLGVWTLAQGEDGRFQWDEHSTFVIEWKGVK